MTKPNTNNKIITNRQRERNRQPSKISEQIIACSDVISHKKKGKRVKDRTRKPQDPRKHLCSNYPPTQVNRNIVPIILRLNTRPHHTKPNQENPKIDIKNNQQKKTETEKKTENRNKNTAGKRNKKTTKNNTTRTTPNPAPKETEDQTNRTTKQNNQYQEPIQPTTWTNQANNTSHTKNQHKKPRRDNTRLYYIRNPPSHPPKPPHQGTTPRTIPDTTPGYHHQEPNGTSHHQRPGQATTWGHHAKKSQKVITKRH